jgi:chromosome segregation ATPase
MDLNKLTHGLALLKSGLDDLDSQCTEQAARCMQLRKEVLQQQRRCKGLQQQAEAVSAELFNRQEQVHDLDEVLQCVRKQAGIAGDAKGHLQVKQGGVALLLCLLLECC